MKRIILVLVFAAVFSVWAEDPLAKGWLKGTTDKSPLEYRTGEEMVFTLTPMEIAGELKAGEWFLCWKRSGDDGKTEKGKAPFDGKTPLVLKSKIDVPGFVRLEAVVKNASDLIYTKPGADGKTPEGRPAMNVWERSKRAIFFDGGAGANVGELQSEPEPDDFDAFWAKQFRRLDAVEIKADLNEIKSFCEGSRMYAIRIDCAGQRPVTGYLSVPKAVEKGEAFPARLFTHGYSGDSCVHRMPDRQYTADEIILSINAHGLKLPEFGATDADTKRLRCEIRSNGQCYAFDPQENADPETAYFNGMVLRVKRALQYLKTVKGWNGKDLIACGGSQGGMQTIWAAGCGEGVTYADSCITWNCDMPNNAARAGKQLANDGWYIPWTPALGYYDAANWAKRIPASCHTFVSRAGLGDYCCPPMGLVKLWNNIPGNKKIDWYQGSEHGYVPPAYEGRETIYEVK